jgi:hypothetical protein
VLITGAKTLAQPGIPALGPALAAALAERHLLATENLAFAEDRWVRYEREA